MRGRDNFRVDEQHVETLTECCLVLPIARIGVGGTVTVTKTVVRAFRPERLLLVRVDRSGVRRSAQASRPISLTNLKIDGVEVLSVPFGMDRTYLPASSFHPAAPAVRLPFWPVRAGQEVAVTLIDNSAASDWSPVRLLRRVLGRKYRVQILLVGRELREPEIIYQARVLGVTATPMRVDGQPVTRSKYSLS